MSCNRPLIAVRGDLLPSGKYKYTPICRYDASLMDKYPDGIKIPCGKCAGCRAEQARSWADRMILELDHSKKAVFLTLTYDDDHVPIKYQCTTGESTMTLQKRDLQLFMKRLRKHYKDKELRMYACGEYGKTTQRPHYHMILYGVDLSDFGELDYRGHNELNQPYWSSSMLQYDIWKNGFCLLAPVSWNTCAYVARYVKKKDWNQLQSDFLDRTKEPEFSVMSRNPGIGMYYPVEHPDFAEKSLYHVGDSNGAVEVHFPKAFLDYLEKNDPDKFLELKEQRSKMSRDSEISNLFQTDLSSMELDELSENQISFTEHYLDTMRDVW